MKKIKYFIFLNVFINYNIFCMNFDNFGPIDDLMKKGLNKDNLKNLGVMLNKIDGDPNEGFNFGELFKGLGKFKDILDKLGVPIKAIGEKITKGDLDYGKLLGLYNIFCESFNEGFFNLSLKDKLLQVKCFLGELSKENLEVLFSLLAILGINKQDADYILTNLLEIEDNKITDLKGIISYLASLILFNGKVSDDVKSKVVEKKDKLVILFHGMGDNAKNFYNSCYEDLSKDYDIVSVEYNNCGGLDNLDVFIKGKVEELKDTISEYDNIYIAGHSLGCFVANKFRKLLIKKFVDRKIHFIFHKGFFDLTRTQIYKDLIDKIKGIIDLIFLEDKELFYTILANLTSNYQLLKDFTMNTKFDFLEVKTGHNYIDLIDAFTIINSSEEGKNKVLFVYSENDNMVGAGGLDLYNELLRIQSANGNEKKDENKLDEKSVLTIKEIMKGLMDKNIEDITDDVFKEKGNLDVNIKEILKEGNSNVDRNNNLDAGRKTDSKNTGNPCCCFPCR